ncbi:hypothetical protein BH11MYX4_BH11MYX4_34620 [soil metagenome]
MKRGSLVVVAVLGLVIACGGSASTADPYRDGGPDAAAADDGSVIDAARDGAIADAAAADGPSVDAGGTCATAGTASKCITCCQGAFPGAGTELVFFQECEQCGAFCSGKAPCGGNGGLAADGGCVKCLSPKLAPSASGWAQCQQSASCKGFVSCFAACPTT